MKLFYSIFKNLKNYQDFIMYPLYTLNNLRMTLERKSGHTADFTVRKKKHFIIIELKRMITVFLSLNDFPHTKE